MDNQSFNNGDSRGCLNPYSNGMLTWTLNYGSVELQERGLNPYSNGMLTWVVFIVVFFLFFKVLILILMECSLGICRMATAYPECVLILILMECSLGLFKSGDLEKDEYVLILILMECSLGGIPFTTH